MSHASTHVGLSPFPSSCAGLRRSVITRRVLQVELTETGSHCNVFGAALTTGKQRQDFHSTVHHKAEGTTCTQEQRNVVSDMADCVFKGRIAIDVSLTGFSKGAGLCLFCLFVSVVSHPRAMGRRRSRRLFKDFSEGWEVEGGTFGYWQPGGLLCRAYDWLKHTGRRDSSAPSDLPCSDPKED